jgi:gliding motility-associated-like protein
MNCSIQFVPQFLSLGGGGNDVWIIHAEPQAEIKIFNRWGNLVFSASPYLDDFDGHSNVGGVLGDDYLPSGTYYYIIDHKNGESPEVGYIEIVH